MARLNGLQMASGFDQTLSDSDNIEAIIPNIGDPQTIKVSKAGEVYVFVDGDPESFSRGQERTDPNAGFSYVGCQQVRFLLPRIHVDSLDYLFENYQGPVTARLRTSNTTYAPYNCQLSIPKNGIRKVGINVRAALLAYTIIEAL